MGTGRRRSATEKFLLEERYVEEFGLPNGRLPLEKTVIQAMMYALCPGQPGQQRSVNEAARVLSYSLIDHWHFCNVYTINISHVQEKIVRIYTEFKTNIQTRVSRQSNAWKERMKKFNERVTSSLFDISTSDAARIQNLERYHDVKMGQDEKDFLEKQRRGDGGYCDGFIDRKWLKTMKRKKEEAARVEKQQQKEAEEYERNSKQISWDEANLEEVDPRLEYGSREENEVEYKPNEPDVRGKKIRREYVTEPMAEEDEMPTKWAHIRSGERQIKPEFYLTVDKLISVFHCSKRQAVAAVVTVGNIMFGRQWKQHNEDKNVIDNDTTPGLASIRNTGKAIHVLALRCIVEEMMQGESTVITYHDDGSKKKSVGSFMVQGISIDGSPFRAFPTLPTESCENLVSLTKTILSICSGVSEAEIMKKIDFRMMDSTSHNYGVDEKVSMDLGIEHVPTELLCSTHPVLMFNREIVNVFAQIEKEIGKDKLYSTVLVDCTTTHDTVLEQFVDVTIRLISKDYSQKSWNYYQQFCKHIEPRKN